MSRPARSGGPSPDRLVAYEVVRRTFEADDYTDRAFRELAGDLDPRDRARAQRLAYGAVQRRGTLDAVIAELADRRPGSLDAPVLCALYLGLFELLYSDSVSEHAVVNEAVELARAGGAGRAAGLVNAVMRRAVRERGRLPGAADGDETADQAALAHSVPRWLAEMWWNEQGAETARALIRAANGPAERAVRVNTVRWDPESARAELVRLGVEVTDSAGADRLLDLPEMIVARGSWAAIEPMIERGMLAPQSRGSAAAVAVLDPKPGDLVLELCAGPGTKTAQLATRIEGQGEVIAVEVDSDRADQIADQVERQRLRAVTVVEGDATSLDLGRGRHHRILLDAPCSDLGALNSRPDVRWRKSPSGVERLVELQDRLLDNAVRHLAPGGVLVYSTCTISAAENEERIAALIDRLAGSQDGPKVDLDDLGAAHPGLASSLDRRFLQIRPDRDDTTGFFIARLTRRS